MWGERKSENLCRLSQKAEEDGGEIKAPMKAETTFLKFHRWGHRVIIMHDSSTSLDQEAPRQLNTIEVVQAGFQRVSYHDSAWLLIRIIRS